MQESDLKEIFKAYYSRLVYFAFQLVLNKGKAEDIVQEAFIYYWKNQDGISSDNLSIKSYLYTTVKNASLNVLRHQQVEEKYIKHFNPYPAEEKHVDNVLINAEVLAQLHQAIESLPANCKKISKMSFLEEMKNQEIADELNISINTVKTQKQRGLQLLRLRLNPELFWIILFALSY